MTKLFLSFLLLVSFNSFAIDQCISKLTNNYSIDSRSFKVDTDMIDFHSHENDYIAQSIELIRAVLNLSGCDGDRDVNFGHGPNGRTKHSCEDLVRGRAVSSACYIETNIGFFFITRDLQTSAFVIYNRWD